VQEETKSWLMATTHKAQIKILSKQVNTVGYARTNVIVSRTSFVIASFLSSIH